MDLFEAVAHRRSIRKYLDEPVADDDLAQMLEAGRAAASWTNNQVWEIVIVKDPETKQRLAETLPKTNPAKKAIANAPVVIAACGRQGESGFYKGQASTALGDWLMFDVALFLANVTHAAHALGYGTVHVGLLDHAAAEQILGVPDGVRLVELMPLGRPANLNKKAPGRKQVSEFLHAETY
ncbi:MAG: nitroreductase family protein [Deltaproteobacteria bacterium]|nr:nitroreductase family protein [Deltaproteobacteria bacterium]